MTSEIDTSYGLFIHDLKSMLYLERKIYDELESMAGEVTNDNLNDALLEHRETTSKHVERLEEVFKHLGMDPKTHRTADYKGIFEEAESLNERVTEVDLINLAFLNVAKKVEHVEIAGYTSLIEMAERLDIDEEITDLLHDNLEEDENTMKRLERLSEKSWWNKLVDKFT